jgi:RNA polymerase sigma-32 factor
MKARFDTSLLRLIHEAARYPILTEERERELAFAWRTCQDRVALDQLVGSHLRLVIRVACDFGGYGLPIADLVGEGNIGLMRAVAKFEPNRGFRFASYAVWWIRAAIQEYVLHSWSLVKIGTTAAQKKLFFNLRRLKTRLQALDQRELAPEAVAAIAIDLHVEEKEVVEMDHRLAVVDHSLNAMVEGASEWLDRLEDQHPSHETVIGENEEALYRRALAHKALHELGPREREIIRARKLTQTPITLRELSRRYALSPEGVRQIELGAVEKMTAFVAAARKQMDTSQRVLTAVAKL